MNGRGYVSYDLKYRNRQSVYEFVSNCREMPFSCSDIAQRTGLSVPTATKIIEFFLSQGLLREVDHAPVSTVGRPPVLFQFNPEAGIAAGCSYDGSHLDVNLINLWRRVRVSRRFAVKDLVSLFREDLPRALNTVLADSGMASPQLLGVGLALPVILDKTSWRTDFPAPRIGLETAFDFEPYCRGLEEKMGCPVFLENDVNAAALGEYQNSTVKDLIYIIVGSGVGSGIILDGKLRSGPHAAAGEIGYMRTSPHNWLEPDAEVSLEKRLSGETMENLLGCRLFGEEANPPLADRVRAAERISDYLALCVQNMSVCLDVDYFVLGGYVIEALRDLVVPMVQEKAGRYCLNPVRILYETLPSAACYGVGAIALEEAVPSLLNDPPAVS
ncbi:MAG TPA: ROK family protein [Firmicutes bacterium]|nr:ROK family protein [Bacillota bacterium]